MTATVPNRPVLVFDGECAFCTRCVQLLERIGPRAEIVAWQLTDLGQLGVTEQQAAPPYSGSGATARSARDMRQSPRR